MRRSKRKTSGLQAAAVAAVCILFVATALLGLYKCFSKEPTPRPDQSKSASAPEDDGPLEPGDAASDALSAGQRKEHFHTILLGGLDDENGGSDTNLLVAVDAQNKRIDVVSLPRDTLLDVSWSVKKLNNAYHHGGFTQTMGEVSRLLGIPIDHYVTVKLNAFEELVDAIGGVEFDIPVDMDYDDPYQGLSIHFPKGPRLLNGEDAPMLEAALGCSIVRTYAEIFQEQVDTDLELANLIWLGEQALTAGSENITFHTLPGDGAGYYKGASYYVLDREAVLELVNTYFNPYQRELTLEDMHILVP